MKHYQRSATSVVGLPRFVLDSPVALGWRVTKLATQYGTDLLWLFKACEAFVPGTWWAEVSEGIRKALRAGAITKFAADEYFSNLSAFTILIDDEAASHTWAGTLALALRHRLPVAKAAYLDLALRFRLPLASDDSSLLRAATAAGVARFVP